MKISIVAFRLIRKAFVLCTRQYANMLQKKNQMKIWLLFFHRNVFIARREVLTIL